MAVTAPGSDLWVLIESTPESARADAKSVTSSSKSVTHGRPHDSDHALRSVILPSFDDHAIMCGRHRSVDDEPSSQQMKLGCVAL